MSVQGLKKLNMLWFQVLVRDHFQGFGTLLRHNEPSKANKTSSKHFNWHFALFSHI